jgi:hypothetical protein
MGRKPAPKPTPKRADLHLSVGTDDHRRICALAGFLGCTVSQLVVRAVEAEARRLRFVVYMGSEGAVGSSPAPSPAPQRPQDEPERPVVGRVG